jgi:hypothetical protein
MLDNDDEVRQVVMELVNEIELMKSARNVLCSKCVAMDPIKNLFARHSFVDDDSISSDDQQSFYSTKQDTVLSSLNEAKIFEYEVQALNNDLKSTDSNATMTIERANSAELRRKKFEVELDINVEGESDLENQMFVVKDKLRAIILSTMDRLHPNVPKDKIPVQASQSILKMIEALDIILNSRSITLARGGKESLDIQPSISPVSSNGGNGFHESNSFDFNVVDDNIELDDDNASFVAYLKKQLDHNAVLIRSALHDMSTDAEGEKNLEDNMDDEDMTVLDLTTVDFKTYESLRRKCDMLEAERDGVVNDTFALLDITKKEHQAEIEAVTNRLKKEAAVEIAQCKEEVIKVTEELKKLKEIHV